MSAESKVVFITGASSGIGAAVAQEFAERGYRVALSARRVSRLEQNVEKIRASGGNAIAVECDVTQEQSIEKAKSEILSKWGRIDIVVANAGFGVNGYVERLSIEDYRRQFETNVFGLLSTIQKTIDEVKNRRGSFALVGSLNSYFSSGKTSAYTMSKHAVKALSDALYDEMRPHGVSVTLICPGFIDTEIFYVNKMGELKKEAARKVSPPKWFLMPARTCARKMVSAILRRKRVRVITAHGKFAVWMERFFPGFVRWVVGLSGAGR